MKFLRYEVLKTFLSQNFEMKDLDRSNYFLGVEVTFGTYGCYFSWSKYALDLLSRAALTNNKTDNNHFGTNVKLLATDDEPPSDVALYR